MNYLYLKQLCLSLIGLSVVMVTASAAEVSNVSHLINLSQHRLILMPEQRQKIVQDRDQYMESLLKPIEVETLSAKPSKKKKRKKVVRYVLQSAIINSQGEGQIQLNNRWFKQHNSPIRFEVDPNNPAFVTMQVGKKRFVVPVGATLLPQKNKILWQSKIKIDSN